MKFKFTLLLIAYLLLAVFKTAIAATCESYPEEDMRYNNNNPQIALLGEKLVVLQYGKVFDDPGAIARDLEDGELTDDIITSASIDSLVAGRYEIVYSATDSAGATSSITRIVEVLENQAPVVILNGANTIQLYVGDTFVDQGATAFDSEDGNLSEYIHVFSNVDTSRAGNYEIHYSVTDMQGLTTNSIRNVNVVEVRSDNFSVAWEDTYTLPEQDENGWSVLRPSEDSHVIYVSSTDGNDDTAIVYDLTKSEHAAVIGDNPYAPIGEVKPYASIKSALAKMRKGYPDYVLLKRGDSWENPSVKLEVYGRSASERAVLASYGDSPTRPLILNSGVFLNKSGYLAVVGLHFYASKRDPYSPDFIGFDQVNNDKGIDATLYNDYGGLLIEDCWFEWFGNNSIQSHSFDEDGRKKLIPDVIVRRNIINNNYSTIAHSQGLYSAEVSMLLEENIFDHNGWFKQGNDSKKEQGKATMFNHNTYFTETKNTIFRNNIFLRASSIGNKFTSNSTDGEGANTIKAWNILLDNNLYIEGEVGISLGGNKDQNDGARWRDIYVINNVMMHLGRTKPTGRELGWGLGVSDWQSGLVRGNVFKSWGSPENKNNYAIQSIGHTVNVQYSENIIYDVLSTNSLVQFKDYDIQHGIDFYHNEIQSSVDANIFRSGRLLDFSLSQKEGFSDNYFYSKSNQDAWFSGQGRHFLNIEEYRNYSGDTTSLLEKRSYIDPERSIGTYLELLGYDRDLDSFINKLKQQSKFSWDVSLTARAINSYIRTGFCISNSANCH